MDYDYDVPLPSIEKDDSQTAQPSSTNTNTNRFENIHRNALESAAETPLPLSSPVRSPRKTPRLQRHGSPTPHVAPSLSRVPSTSSPLNPDRRSSTPLLQNKRSTTSLKRGETPLRQLPSRQSSYNFPSSSSPGAAMQQPYSMNGQSVERKPPITAASVARDYFHKEMLQHESADCNPRTVMFIHDSCYGHRYSRPRTSKSLLSTIVERPERIHASVLGLSTAYVRMGGRHAGGLAALNPDRDPQGGSGVPFKICKTSRSVSLNSMAATHVHGQKWMEELQIMCDSAEGKLALNGKELVRPIGYGKDESGNPLPKLHEGDLYLCSQSLGALEGCLGGVCDAVDAVFSMGNTRRAFVCIRPPGHHCSSNYPSGFCWINNVHAGITHAAINHGLTHAAIIDFDLHHGDGSQTIAWDHNRKALDLPRNAAPHKRTPIGYFSLHDINSYPCEMGDEEKVRNASLCIENAHGQSIWNVHLEPWKTHADFWRLYETKYIVLIHKARSFLRHHTEKLSNSGLKAKAAIFLSAGFDASEWEGEGMQRHKVNVPTDFYARFTADVVKLAEEEGLGVDGRVISVLEGGYSDRALTSGVLSHVCGLAEIPNNEDKSEPSAGDGLSTEMRRKLGLLEINDRASVYGYLQSTNSLQLDAEWWNLASLESLEALVNSRAGNPPAVKSKDKAGNYTSPTQASSAKMTDQARVRRSLSSQLDRMMGPEPIPPLPEVDWPTAAYELSRLLIPADRQTLSCRFDELNAEATRVRRERQSTIGLPTNGEQRMQLRDRKAKPSDEEATKPFNRRKTIAAVGELPDPHTANGQVDTSSATRARRRSSGTSSVLSGFRNMQISEPAQSSRASSVISEKPKVAVRKPRVVNAAKGPKKTSGTAPPVPQLTFVDATQATSRSASELVADDLQLIKATDEELDSLSSSVKKMSIKLKVPSPEENAVRERKAAEAQTKKVRPRKPVVAKVPNARTAVNKTPLSSVQPSVQPVVERDGNDALHNPVPNLLESFPVDLTPSVITNPSFENIKPEASEGGPVDSVPAISARPTSPTGVMRSSVGVQDSLPPEIANRDAEATPASDSLKEFDVVLSSSPASANRTRADLPVFTSSSPIPFGRPVLSNLNENLQDPVPQDVSQQEPLHVFGSTTIHMMGNSPGKATGVGAEGQLKIGSDASEASGPSGASETSIWDVPETPQRSLV